MRLERLTLHNFRAFAHAAFDLSDATVLVGTNNAGKSTIFSALRALFGVSEQGSSPWSWANVTSRPIGWSQRRYADESRLADVGSATWVAASFGALSDTESDLWKPVTEGKQVTFGAVWPVGAEGPHRCLVLGEERWKSLTSAITRARGWPPFDARSDAEPWISDRESAGDNSEVQDFLRVAYAPIRPEGSNAVWITWWNVAGVLLPIWPSPRPTPESDFGDSVTFRNRLVSVPGYEQQPTPDAILAAVVRSRVVAGWSQRSPEKPHPDLGDVVRDVSSGAGETVERVSRSYQTAVARYLEESDVQPKVVRRAIADLDLQWMTELLLDQIIGSVSLALVPVAGDADPPRIAGQDFEELGWGARRAAALASLELFRDPELWDPTDWVVLAVEEPEAGLHPVARHRVAQNLARLPAFGVQVVVTTHEPSVVNAFQPEALRTVQQRTRVVRIDSGLVLTFRDHNVISASSMEEMRDLLRPAPGDALMAEAYVVVEGPSDAAIMQVWMDATGLDMRGGRIRLVPARGHGLANQVAQFLDLIYPGAAVTVLLDNGPQARSTAMEVSDRFGGRVRVHQLARTEIEAYFTTAAVSAWLRLGGVDNPSGAVERFSASNTRKRTLREISASLLHRDYRVVEDGLAIASHMKERDLDPELRALFMSIFPPGVR